MEPSTTANDLQINEIIEQSLAVINAAEVYFSTGEHNQQLTYLVDTTYVRIDNDLHIPLNDFFKAYPTITYRVFSCDYAADALRKGNLYFLEHCLLGKKLFSASDSQIAFDETNPAILLPRAKKLFKKAMGKIDGRYASFPKLLRNEKYLDAAYVLHQMFEQLYKAAELFLLGKQLFTKDIAGHQQSLISVSPTLAKLFDVENKEQNTLLDLINSVYIAYQRRDSLDVSRQQIEQILYKTQYARQEIEKLFKDKIALCYNKANIEPEIIAKPANETDKELIDDLKTLEYLKCFSKKHFRKLKPCRQAKGWYTVEVRVLSYFDAFAIAHNLIKICLMTLENDAPEISNAIPNTRIDSRDLLEIALQLMPIDEIEMLDEIHKLVRNKNF